MSSSTTNADLQRRYDALVQRSLAGVFRTTLDGRLLEANDALARILGYRTAEELMRQPLLELYPSAAAREAFLEALRTNGQLVNHEMVLRHRSGRDLHVLENVFIDSAEDGEATIQGTLIDITARKQAELEQRSLIASYRSLVEHIRDGLLVVKDGRVTYANPAAETLCPAPPLGTEVLAMFHADDRASILERLRAPELHAGPLPVRMNGSRETGLVLSVSPAPHHGHDAVQLTLQDQRAQQQLMKEQLRLQMIEEVNQVLRQEISDHRRTQEELRRSRRFARSLIDSSLDMIMAADPNGVITEYNPAASVRFGYEPEEIIGTNVRALYADPAEHDRVLQELDSHGMYTGEVRNITRTGEVFTSFLAASRLYDEDGELLGAMGVSRDITRLKRDQEALKASEERYRDLFENATDLIQSVDPQGRFEYVNTAWHRTLGYSAEELSSLHFMDIVAPDHQAHCRRSFDQLMQGEDPGRIDTVFLAKDGSRVHVVGTSNLRTVEGKPIATRSIFHDVTAERTASLRVQEHEAKQRALFQSSEHLFWTVDRDLKITSYNAGYANMIKRLYGSEPDLNRDLQRPRRLFAEPDYHDFWEEKYAIAFSGQAVRFETDRTDTEGRRVCNEIFLSPVIGQNGTITEVFGIGHEVTEQIAAEELAREQSARLKAIFDSAANMMIWTLDRDLRLTSYNERFLEAIEEDFGVRLSVGDPFVDKPAQQAAGSRTNNYRDRYLAALKGKPQQFEAELTDKHGRTIWVENFLNPIVVDGQVQELSCLAYHITDRKLAQTELLKSLHEKEVLLKEVHHRVKNNLQIISSIFNLQSAHVGDDQRMIGLLRDSRDRIRSMSFIHESLYQTKDFSSIDLADYIDGLSRNLVMSYSLNGKVDLQTDLQQVHLVLDQAIPCGLILNELISNALKHAFPNDRSGTIRIALRLAGEQVRIEVSDNGVGLPAGFRPETHSNLGLELVDTLIGQLDGAMDRRSEGGVSYLLTFERSKTT
ncbi:MAG: PAS domain S-box protein [Flavobacteriales bacterium]